jgi:hypothetical protein
MFYKRCNQKVFYKIEQSLQKRFLSMSNIHLTPEGDAFLSLSKHEMGLNTKLALVDLDFPLIVLIGIAGKRKIITYIQQIYKSKA